MKIQVYFEGRCFTFSFCILLKKIAELCFETGPIGLAETELFLCLIKKIEEHCSSIYGLRFFLPYKIRLQGICIMKQIIAC